MSSKVSTPNETAPDNPWAVFDDYIDRVAVQCVNDLTPKWSNRRPVLSPHRPSDKIGEKSSKRGDVPTDARGLERRHVFVTALDRNDRPWIAGGGQHHVHEEAIPDRAAGHF